MFQVDFFSIVETIQGAVETVRFWDKAGTKDAGAYTVGVKMHLLKKRKHLKWLVETRLSLRMAL